MRKYVMQVGGHSVRIQPVDVDLEFKTVPDHIQRMTTLQWKYLLLSNKDIVHYSSYPYRLKSRSLGAGVVEVSRGEAA